MSATEIISEIAKLPVPEQERVLDFLQNGRNKRKATGTEVRYADDEDFDKAADNVLRDRADLFRRLAK
jgi:hypothetical protein